MSRYLILAASLLASTGAFAQGPAASAIFEQYGLIGIWSVDCVQPASRQNTYIIFRTTGGAQVQRDVMIDAATRSSVSTIDSAAVVSSNEIKFVQDNERGRLTINVILANNRWRALRSVRENGEKLIENGLFAGDHADTPWLNKCGGV